MADETAPAASARRTGGGPASGASAPAGAGGGGAALVSGSGAADVAAGRYGAVRDFGEGWKKLSLRMLAQT